MDLPVYKETKHYDQPSAVRILSRDAHGLTRAVPFLRKRGHSSVRLIDRRPMQARRPKSCVLARVRPGKYAVNEAWKRRNLSKKGVRINGGSQVGPRKSYIMVCIQARSSTTHYHA